jgi:competence protein ComEA
MRARRWIWRRRAAAAVLCGLVLCRAGGRVHAQDGGPRAEPAVSAAGPPRLDLNRADASALEGLPGIGASRAQAIVAYRASHGGFRSVNELLRIRGIGRKLLARLREHVSVGPAGRAGADPVR